MLRPFEQADQFAFGKYMATHRLYKILAIRASAKIEYLIQCENLEMIMMWRIAFRRMRPFVTDTARRRIRALAKSHRILQAIQTFETFSQCGYGCRECSIPPNELPATVSSWRRGLQARIA